MTVDAFHAGEQALQRRVGARDRMARLGQKTIRPYMPDQHRDFFEMLTYIFVGGVDGEGQPWASFLAGDKGFIRSPGSQHLEIAADLPLHDPLQGSLIMGNKLGLVGIELPTKRRNRMNGVVVPGQGEALTIRVDQSFGNCPKYITQRHLALANCTGCPKDVEGAEVMVSTVREAIARADIFFIASRSATLSDNPRDGIDMSHRGGPAGFVTVTDAKTLSFPDYRGNRFFNTLGNIQTDPRVGLLFLDFAGDRIIQIAGKAEVIWDGEERRTEVTVDQVRVNPNVLMVEKAIAG